MSSLKDLTQNEIDKMTVNDLKAELKVRGASTQGKKADLAARLAEHCHTSDVAENEQTEHSVPTVRAADVVESGSRPDESNQKNDESQPLTHFSANEEITSNDGGGDFSGQLPSMKVDQSINEDEKPSSNAIAETVPSQSLSTSEIPPSAAGIARSNSSSIQDRVKEKIKAIQQQKLMLPETNLPSNSVDAFDSSSQQTVRIDNFQRPLNIKSLLAWLSDMLSEEIFEDRLWVNAIKTHCYLDFPTHTAAQNCIDIISGKRCPASSTAVLVASFTKVSAKEAPLSTEAALKPGEWKTVLNVGFNDDSENNKRPELTPSSSLGKRKVDDDSNTEIKREVISSTLFQRATAGAFKTDGATLEANSKRKRKDVKDHDIQREDQPLENLFRKTVARPVLYWQPVSDDLVKQRRNSR